MRQLQADLAIVYEVDPKQVVFCPIENQEVVVESEVVPINAFAIEPLEVSTMWTMRVATKIEPPHTP